MAASVRTAGDRELLALMNLGPRTLGYLHELGVRSVQELARQSADELYVRLQHQRGVAFDPCLHDVFTAVIAQAKGEPAGPGPPTRRRGNNGRRVAASAYGRRDHSSARGGPELRASPRSALRTE